ncbi:hypothetical protein C0992_002824 [Termitomyces sp. T32_za158]|nr:hypothetical protein C0992_002824 [Termitomyces sp. T32_za158]
MTTTYLALNHKDRAHDGDGYRNPNITKHTSPTAPPATANATSTSTTSFASIPTSTSVVPVTATETSITFTTSAAFTTISNSGSAEGFFENTGAVAGTFTAVGLVLLALLTFLTTCFIRRHRRQFIFDREAFAEAAGRFEPALLDDKHNSPHKGAVAHMRSDASIYGTYVQQSSATTSTEDYVTKSEENAYGVAGVCVEHDDAYSRQDQVPSTYVHAQSQQDLGHNASVNFRSTLLHPETIPILKQSTHTSQSVHAQVRGSGFYCQLLKAAGLDPGSRSLLSGAEVQQSSPVHVSARIQQRGTGAAPAGLGGAYGGYVDEHEYVY